MKAAKKQNVMSGLKSIKGTAKKAMTDMNKGVDSDDYTKMPKVKFKPTAKAKSFGKKC